jgi:hypothetical protein
VKAAEQLGIKSVHFTSPEDLRNSLQTFGLLA